MVNGMKIMFHLIWKVSLKSKLKAVNSGETAHVVPEQSLSRCPQNGSVINCFSGKSPKTTSDDYD